MKFMYILNSVLAKCEFVCMCVCVYARARLHPYDYLLCIYLFTYLHSINYVVNSIHLTQR